MTSYVDRIQDEKHQKILAGLKALPENEQCANCTEKNPRFVCTDFDIFICGNCASIHREFGHRTKSVGLSTFSKDEVDSLKMGGNKFAHEKWLAKWTRSEYFTPNSSDTSKLREFIRLRFVEKKWLSSNVGSSRALVPVQQPTQQQQQQYGHPHQHEQQKPAYGMQASSAQLQLEYQPQQSQFQEQHLQIERQMQMMEQQRQQQQILEQQRQQMEMQHQQQLLEQQRQQQMLLEQQRQQQLLEQQRQQQLEQQRQQQLLEQQRQQQLELQRQQQLAEQQRQQQLLEQQRQQQLLEQQRQQELQRQQMLEQQRQQELQRQLEQQRQQQLLEQQRQQMLEHQRQQQLLEQQRQQQLLEQRQQQLQEQQRQQQLLEQQRQQQLLEQQRQQQQMLQEQQHQQQLLEQQRQQQLLQQQQQQRMQAELSQRMMSQGQMQVYNPHDAQAQLQAQTQAPSNQWLAVVDPNKQYSTYGHQLNQQLSQLQINAPPPVPQAAPQPYVPRPQPAQFSTHTGAPLLDTAGFEPGNVLDFDEDQTIAWEKNSANRNQFLKDAELAKQLQEEEQQRRDRAAASAAAVAAPAPEPVQRTSSSKSDRSRKSRHERKKSEKSDKSDRNRDRDHERSERHSSSKGEHSSSRKHTPKSSPSTSRRNKDKRQEQQIVDGATCTTLAVVKAPVDPATTCTACNYAAGDPETLKRHRVTECVFRVVGCVYCGKTVKQIQHKEHMELCATKKHHCQHCGVALLGSDLLVHLRSVHGVVNSTGPAIGVW